MSQTSLPAYTVEFQMKVLAYMANDAEFASIAGAALEAEYFADSVLQWFFEYLGKSPIQHTFVTLREEMVKQANEGLIRQDQVNRFVELYNYLKTPPTPDEQTYITESLSKFVRTQKVKQAITSSVDLIKQEEWGAIESLMTEALRSGFDTMSTGHDFFAEYQERIKKRALEEKNTRILTMIPDLDKVLQGGLEKKQVGLVAGGTGRGKSLFLQWLGRAAILLGYKVLYITLELSEEKIAARYDSMFCRIKPQDLLENTKKALEELEPYKDTYGGRLIIKEYPADTATVGTLKNFYRQMSSMGHQADVVLVDYLDLLKPHRTYNKKHEELDAITVALHGFCKEMNVAVWTATQLNRAGIVMETPDEASIAGALAKLYTVDVALFLAQTSEERELEEMRIIVSKNRNGPAGRIIKLETDYSYLTFYRNALEGSKDDDNA